MQCAMHVGLFLASISGGMTAAADMSTNKVSIAASGSFQMVSGASKRQVTASRRNEDLADSQSEDASFELEMLEDDSASDNSVSETVPSGQHQLAEIEPHASKKLIRNEDQQVPASAIQTNSADAPNVPYWAQYRISQMMSANNKGEGKPLAPVAAAPAATSVVAATAATPVAAVATAPTKVAAAAAAPPKEAPAAADQPEVAAPIATGAVAPDVAKPPVARPAVVSAPEPLATDAAAPSPVVVPATPKTPSDIKPASNQSLSAPQAIFNSTVATAANATSPTPGGKIITAKGAVVSIFLGFLVTMFFLSGLVLILNAGQRENAEGGVPEKEPPRPTPSYRQLLKAQQQSESSAASSNPRVV